MAHAQQLAWFPPSCARLISVRVQERRERAGSRLAQATRVWGRGASLERGAALVGGHFGERGVSERERKIGKTLHRVTSRSSKPVETSMLL
jgi:hypothetical protein